MTGLGLRSGPDKLKNIMHSADLNIHETHEISGLEAWITPPNNFVGTTLFLTYIAAALVLTSFILFQDIIPRWQSSRKAFVLTTLAVTSFSALSYNMISFLHESLRHYLDTVGQEMSIKSVWAWMLSSSLFTTFAKSLLADVDVITWSMQGLMMIMFIGAEMSTIGMFPPSFTIARANVVLGRQHEVKHLWIYFCLAQILPPAFAYYCLRLRANSSVLSRPGGMGKQTPADAEGSKSITRIVVSLSIIVLTIASVLMLEPVNEFHDTDWLVLARVLWLRLLLFAPLYTDVGSVLPVAGQDRHRGLLSNQYFLSSAIFAAILYGKNMAIHNYAAFYAGFTNPAIRTLSCDWIIKIMGDVISWCFTG